MKEDIVQALSLISRPRLFYRTYLSRYVIFRLAKQIILWIYFCSPSFFTKLRLVLITSKRSFLMMPMAEFLNNEQISWRVVKGCSITEVPGPFFDNTCPIGLAKQDIVRVVEPEIKVVEIPGVMAVGGTNLLLKRNIAIHPDLQQPTRDVIPAEYLGVATVDAASSKISLSLNRKHRRINRAISLLGNCTGNYAHWLTETLPKLAIIDEIEEFRNYPLLVDQWIHPNILESIQLLNKQNRKIIGVDRWEAVLVEALVDVSPPAYVPPESRSFFDEGIFPQPSPDVFSYSSFALNQLRQVVLDEVKPGDISDTFERIYIRRPIKSVGNGRLVVNNEELDRVIAEYGFTAIEPGGMSFVEQVRIFRQAKCIVAPIGAGLVNAIFAPTGCQIIVMSPYYEKANYYYFSNLMGILGHRLRYVLGPQSDCRNGTDHLCHKNYLINISELRAALNKV